MNYSLYKHFQVYLFVKFIDFTENCGITCVLMVGCDTICQEKKEECENYIKYY